jgi:uncharacterized surface protein with fasciclin (FAS1) repeats
MRCTTAVLLLGLALCVASTQAQDKKTTDIVAAMNSNGHKLAAAVLDVAGVTKHASDPKARYTFLLPTDAAVEKFLKDMGLTVDDLKKRPMLAKQLVAQHTLLRSNVRESEIFEKGDTRKAATLASKTGLGLGNDDIEFKRAGGKVTVTDPQGNVANVVGKPVHPDENKTIIPIDRVLMGDQYYTSFADVCKHRSERVSAFCDAVKTAGLGDALTPSKLDATVFVPNNAAFKKATEKGAPSKDALATILKYHVVPGARELPKGWKEGAAAKTLESKELKLNYVKKSAAGTKAKFDWSEARVIPADGTPVPILRSNVHVGKAVVHGIGSVLLPNAAPAVTTEKGATPAAKPAAAAPAAAPKAPGRRLLDWGWGMSAGPTAAQDDVSGQIEQAVNGNESTAAVANSARLQAEELSVPGDYNQVMNGINPW